MLIKPRPTIASLQVLRGLAAVAVAFYHVYIIMMDSKYGGLIVFQAVAKNGYLGVNFFFVLSGFIIFLAHRSDIGNIRLLPNYFYKRIIRVYPVYFIYLTGFIFMSWAVLGQSDFSYAPLNFLSAYLLVPIIFLSAYLLVPIIENYTLPLKVAWTLFYEIRFYMLFAIFFIIGTKGFIIFAIWTVLIIGNYLDMINFESNFLSLWNIYFLFGMLGVYILPKTAPKYGVLLVGMSIVLFIVFFTLGHDIVRIANLEDQHEGLHFVLAPAFLLLIVGTILIERRRAIVYPRILMLLGNASYSIYLVHSAAISLFMIIATKVELIEHIGSHAVFIFAFIFSLVAGAIAYFMIEKPIMMLARRRRRHQH